MAQLWGMINGMQIALNIPAMNIDMPAPVFKVVSKIVMVACFDIPGLTLEKLPKVYPIP
jgi:hypothetical protein